MISPNSPLQLERSLYDRVAVEAVQEYTPGSPVSLAGEIAVELTPGFDGTDLYALTLAVKVHAPEGLPLPPYTVDVRSIGYFQYREDSAEETPAEQLNRIVSVNGASLLYSGIRELVAAITARGPWGQVLLPTVDFRAIPVKVTQPEVEPASEANEADEAAR